jgi:hypothetical protein
MTDTTTNDSTTSTSDEGTIAWLERVLSHCRTRIDELKVQIDLGSMTANDVISKEMEEIQNAYLAARSKLRYARASGSDLTKLHEDVVNLLRDLKSAYDAVTEVVRRSHDE